MKYPVKTLRYRDGYHIDVTFRTNARSQSAEDFVYDFVIPLLKNSEYEKNRLLTALEGWIQEQEL